ncbi:sensor domain-containing diguanylate cyclase [Bacillus marasmi]|uniref:sensor domain-containing diguanylate cyclase n=1 Tax=Bacillus marasmi TaxID=1926279 RepID=UPI0011CC101D|nr:sensor domain-containing diguanylate cyclase [Bacillus marasmi]
MDFWKKKYSRWNSMIFINIIGVLTLKLVEMIVFQKLIHWFWSGDINEELVDIIVFIIIMTPFTYIVTKQKKTIQNAEKKYRILAEDSLIGIYTIDDGKITYTNQRFLEMSGYASDELIGKSIFDFVHPEDLPTAQDSLRRKLSGELQSTPLEIRGVKKDHSIIDVEIYGTVINCNGKPQILGSVLDNSGRKLNEKLLKDLAYRDSLTNLTNRRYFKENFKNSVSMLNNAAIMFFDLDGFKAVNDSYGHEIGDSMLIEVGNRISSCFRSNDTFSRLGGDEFIAFLPNVDENKAIAIAKRIIEDINKPFTIHNQTICVSTSIGIAFYGEGGNDVDTLIKNADIAMYQAKIKGKNTFAIYN